MVVASPERARFLLPHLTLVLIGGLLPCGPCRAGPAPTVYFYSPETNINHYSLLKTEFDTYLAGHGRYRFQPFSKQADFEKFVASKNEVVLLVSSWHFRKLRDTVPLEPVLVGVLRNGSTQRRVLSAKKSVEGLFSLGGQKITSAGSKEFTQTVLLSMLGDARRELVESFKILVVPKDIDALMAVSFGMSKAALTTEGSLDKLRKINPKKHGQLHQLASSEGALLPLVAVSKGSGARVQNLVAVIAAMGDKPEGAKCLKMIGLDGLRKLDDSQKRTLLE